MSPIDFGRHSDDYATYRPGPPASFYDRLDAIAPIAGSRSLDLATGPGPLALELAARGSRVVAIDTSPELVATARRVAAARGLDQAVEFEVARAEATGLDAGSFDLVTAGQCWHWFDGPAALAEIRRVLGPGGVLAIVHYSYLAGHSPVARDTEALVLQFNPSWTMGGSSGMFPDEVDEIIQGGFDLVEAFCYQYDQPFSHERWRGRIRTCNGVGSGGMSPEDVERFDEALGHLLQANYPDPVSVPHRVWCVVGRTPREEAR